MWAMTSNYELMANLDKVIWKSINGLAALKYLELKNAGEYRYYREDLIDAIKEVKGLKGIQKREIRGLRNKEYFQSFLIQLDEIIKLYSNVSDIISKKENEIRHDEVVNAIELLQKGTSDLQGIFGNIQREILMP